MERTLSVEMIITEELGCKFYKLTPALVQSLASIDFESQKKNSIKSRSIQKKDLTAMPMPAYIAKMLEGTFTKSLHLQFECSAFLLP
ncbi:CLUMA_CG000290, isoform A [Clunio marinus]|uniref:CLUMA_CG000290, isoform A n=1 Tax=Clunio marinus TaxID=568069 RepID=A0A1J1HGK8_9DIPT|nr:CLUMA_CG000290, isoform A [Clunio marinus]